MEPSQPNTLCTVSASGGPTSSGKLDEEEMMLMLEGQLQQVQTKLQKQMAENETFQKYRQFLEMNFH